MEIFEKLKIKPNNPYIYQLAFLHESYSNENNLTECYERLEFLGDAVLDLVVSEYLYNSNTDLTEGELTRQRSNYVCKQALHTYSTELGFHQYIKLGNGMELTKREIDSIKSDVFESFIGALYLDQDLDTVKKFLTHTVIPHIKRGDVFFCDYKSELKQLCDQDGHSITYKLIKEEGKPHNKTFQMACVIDGKPQGTGLGGNKKEAEQNASRMALDNLSNP
ncbi:MAG TPA: ribonuclease III [Methanothermobacter sp.]|nr:ribonuclease III [Methanothermobacter sp.]